ncbi:MAG: ABC transporter ATP-binding protein [Nonlabens sp.]|nr:ABC transporter ATP-binding protein [Nonlabens sp.]
MDFKKLIVKDVELKRGNKTLLKEASFTIKAGEVIGILGSNGCGKSSLLQVLFGTVKAQNISVSYNEQPFTISKNRQNRIFGYLPQDPFLFNNITVNETIHTWFPDNADQDRLLYEPLIHTISKKRVGSLSMGERRFLECMLVINLEQPVLLLDEPFSALAPLQIERAIDLITERCAHKAVFITDHYYEHVLKIADRTLLLKNAVLVETNEDGLVTAGYVPKSS